MSIEIDSFTQAYVVALLWSTNDESDENTGGNPLDDNYSIDDITDDTMSVIAADCKRFQNENAVDLELAYTLYARKDWSVEEQAGHDFALTRNRHGAGFHDRGIGEVGKRLANTARAYGEFTLCVGDNGKIDHL